jgi:hypothetical protein
MLLRSCNLNPPEEASTVQWPLPHAEEGFFCHLPRIGMSNADISSYPWILEDECNSGRT